MRIRKTIAITTMCLFSTPAFSQSTTNVGFDGGSDGGFIGNASFESTGGNPDGSAHHFVTAFFMSLRTGGLGEPVNPNFLGDYSPFEEVSFGFDVKVDSLTDFIGNPIAREIGIALVDRDIQGPSGPSGVFFTLGALSSAGQPDWTNLSVTIDDPTSETLPPGWIGFGDEDPNTFEPILPPGATFATVLAGVDEFRISGAIPGFFFNNANFDVRIDNVSVTLPSSTETICPDDANDFLRLAGGTPMGDALDTCASDDVRLVIPNLLPFSPIFPFCRVDIWAHTTFAAGDVASLDYVMEGGVTALVPGGQNPDTLRTYIRNYTNGAFEVVDQRATADPATDELVTHTQAANAPDYVQAGDGEVRIRVDAWDPGSVLNASWSLRVDQYEVTVSP